MTNAIGVSSVIVRWEAPSEYSASAGSRYGSMVGTNSPVSAL